MQGVAQCVGWFVLSARGGASVSGSFSERCLLFIHVILTIRILQVSMSWCATELVEMGVPSKWRVICHIIMASSLYRPLGYRVPGRPTLFNSWQTCIGTT